MAGDIASFLIEGGHLGPPQATPLDPPKGTLPAD